MRNEAGLKSKNNNGFSPHFCANRLLKVLYNHCCRQRCSRKGQQKTEMGARVKDVPSENGTTLVPILMRAIFSPEAEVIQVEILPAMYYNPLGLLL
jgi:hypothetical protein